MSLSGCGGCGRSNNNCRRGCPTNGLQIPHSFIRMDLTGNQNFCNPCYCPPKLNLCTPDACGPCCKVFPPKCTVCPPNPIYPKICCPAPCLEDPCKIPSDKCCLPNPCFPPECCKKMAFAVNPVMCPLPQSPYKCPGFCEREPLCRNAQNDPCCNGPAMILRALKHPCPQPKRIIRNECCPMPCCDPIPHSIVLKNPCQMINRGPLTSPSPPVSFVEPACHGQGYANGNSCFKTMITMNCPEVGYSQSLQAPADPCCIKRKNKICFFSVKPCGGGRCC